MPRMYALVAIWIMCVLPLQFGNAKMFYIPSTNTVMCACKKCGTTALLQWLFKSVFGREFVEDWRKGRWIKNLDDPQWEHRLIDLSDTHMDPAERRKYIQQINETIFQETHDEVDDQAGYAIAIIRDPVARIMASYRAGLACPSTLKHPIKSDSAHKRIAPLLQNLSGVPHIWEQYRVNPVSKKDEWVPCYKKKKVFRSNGQSYVERPVPLIGQLFPTPNGDLFQGVPT